jgi:hypothetical protein
VRDATEFSVKTATVRFAGELPLPGTVRSLLRLGPPPPDWVRLAVTLLISSSAACASLAAAGAVFRGDPGKYFGDKLIANALSGGLLLATGACCFGTARATTARDPKFARFWTWSALLFAAAGMDDLLRIHERADVLVHRLAGLDPRNPLTTHLDDLIVASYAVPALLLGVRYRAELVRFRWMVVTLAIAFAGFCLMVVCDFLGASKAVEDGTKIISATLILIAFLSVRYDPSVVGAAAHDPHDPA